MAYKVLFPIRANGKVYAVDSTIPSNLKKVNYQELLDKNLVVDIAPATTPKAATTPVVAKEVKEVKVNTKG